LVWGAAPVAGPIALLSAEDKPGRTKGEAARRSPLGSATPPDPPRGRRVGRGKAGHRGAAGEGPGCHGADPGLDDGPRRPGDLSLPPGRHLERLRPPHRHRPETGRRAGRASGETRRAESASPPSRCLVTGRGSSGDRLANHGPRCVGARSRPAVARTRRAGSRSAITADRRRGELVVGGLWPVAGRSGTPPGTGLVPSRAAGRAAAERVADRAGARPVPDGPVGDADLRRRRRGKAGHPLLRHSGAELLPPATRYPPRSSISSPTSVLPSAICAGPGASRRGRSARGMGARAISSSGFGPPPVGRQPSARKIVSRSSV